MGGYSPSKILDGRGTIILWRKYLLISVVLDAGGIFGKTMKYSFPDPLEASFRGIDALIQFFCRRANAFGKRSKLYTARVKSLEQSKGVGLKNRHGA